MKTRLFTLFLAFCLIAAPVVFAACNDSADDDETTAAVEGDGTGDTAADTGGNETDAETVVEELDIPDVNYEDEDYTFTILTNTDLSYSYGSMDFDEPSDDLREQALYERSVAIEELLGITIEMKQESLGEGVYDLFQTDVESGTAVYAITLNNMSYSCTAVGAGYCYVIDEVPYIDLDKSWWNADCTEQLALGGNHYMVSGDISLSDKECIWMVYYMKDVLAEVAADVDLYQMVRDGTWTWDAMYSLAQLAVFDNNANGERDSADRYGITTHSENWPAFWQSAGLKLVSIDSDGYPYVSWGTDEFFAMFEDIKTIMGDTDTVSPESDSFIKTSVLQCQTLFATEVVAHMNTYRDSEYDFGILPFPKYTEEQDRYYSYVAVSSCVCVIPITTLDSDIERVGIITEALAYYGQQILTPAYYDVQLQSRFSRDPQDAEMLDIVFEYRSYDMGVFFNWGSAYSSLQSATANPATLYASLNKAITKAMEKSLQKLGLY
ncbi:MAG: hypothetical protein LUI15_01770 [Firmicutes bacterium]|nr:hypothetical protein [Bacillota bacterium]